MKIENARLYEKSSREERLSRLLETFSERRVVVIGDLVADQFLYGEIARISREAPVFILRHERTETVPGGAANCAANLASLGSHVELIGITGDDESGRALLGKLCDAKVDCNSVIKLPSHRTTTKVRILAGQAHSTRQQVIRVDYEDGPIASSEIRKQLISHLHAALARADAVIVSDYNYGVADSYIADILRSESRERGLPVLVDSRFRLKDFSGFTSATPNEDEVEHVLDQRLYDSATLERAGEALREQLGFQALLITRGSQGMLLLEKNTKPLYMGPIGAREAVDVTGAGDTVIAAYALALASGASFADAAHLANHAGGIVVMKRGTATVSRDELLASVLHGGGGS